MLSLVSLISSIFEFVPTSRSYDKRQQAIPKDKTFPEDFVDDCCLSTPANDRHVDQHKNVSVNHASYFKHLKILH